MTNKQAVETLRRWIGPRFGCRDNIEACRRGADAIEMLEWLLEGERPILRISRDLHMEWLDIDDARKPTFRAFCEAKWRESRGE